MTTALAFFGGWGTNELLLLLAVALLIFGGKKLPELARSLGKSINEFRRGIREIEEDIEGEEQDKKLGPPSTPQDAYPESQESGTPQGGSKS